MTEQHVEEQLAAYALGALDESAATAVASHLQRCPHCRAALDEYEEVVGLLAYASTSQEPPPLKEALLERARRQRPDAAPQPSSTPAHSSDWLTPLRRLLRPAWAAVALLVIFLLAAGNFALWQAVQEARQEPAFATVQLAGDEAAPDASGLIVISNDGQHGSLVVQDLPPLDPAQQYQLWLLIDDQRDDGGVFSVTDSGYASHYINAPRPLVDYTAFGITIEPAGGSDGPTGERVLGGSR